MLNSAIYEVMPHPAVPSVAYGQEGCKAVVYQLRGGSEYFALKVFKRQFHEPNLVDIRRPLTRSHPG